MKEKKSIEFQIEGQLDLFGLFRSMPEPTFAISQRVYEVSLDVILEGTVESSFECSRGIGYTIALDSEYGGYTTVWDDIVNIDVFDNKEDAIRLAKKVSAQVVKFNKEELIPFLKGQRSWKYKDEKLTLGNGKPYVIYSTIAMIGECGVYVDDWMKYPFYYTFSTPKEAEKFYSKCLSDIYGWIIMKPSMIEEMIEQRPIKDMYRCNENLYSDWQYAMRHGNPFKEERGQL